MRLEINRRAAWANGPDRWNLDDADTGHRLGYIAPDHNGGWTAHVAGRDTVEGTWLEQSDALKAARRAIEAKEARFDRWLENHPGTAPDETSRPPIAFQRDIRIMASQETDDYRLVHEGWDVGSVGRDGDAWTVTDAYGRTRSHASLYEALDQAVLRADRWLEENDPQSREDRIVDEWHDWDVTTEQLESHRPTAHEIVRQNIGFQRTMRTRLDAAGMEHAIVRSIDGPTILAAPYERDAATIIELDDGRRIIASATDRNERIRTVIGETDHGYDILTREDLDQRIADHDGWLPIKDDGWSFTSGKPLVLSPTIRAKDYWEKSVEKLVDVLDEDARPLAETRKESRSEPDKDKPQHQHHHTR